MRRRITMVAVLVIYIGVAMHLLQQGDLLWVCTILMIEPTEDMSTTVMGMLE